MPAGVYNFDDVEQGISWSYTLHVSGLDLTGKSVRGQIRATIDGPVLANFTCVVDGQDILLSMAASVTALLTSSGVYDLEVYSGSPEVVERLLKGRVTVSPEVTR